MCQFIETIRIDSGEARNLTYHEQRLNDTRNHFWPGSHALQLADFLPPVPESGIHKLRIVYGQDGIEDVTCTPYLLRPVRSLALIQADEIGYTYKSTDRQVLDRLFAQRGSCDDILIVRRHLLTDTSIANIALFDGKHWHTPQSPLLDKGILSERKIHVEDIPSYSTVRLFNAMIDWGELELPAVFVQHSGHPIPRC